MTRRTTSPSGVRASESTVVRASSTPTPAAAALSSPVPPLADSGMVGASGTIAELSPDSRPISRRQMRSSSLRSSSRYSRALRLLKSAATTRGEARDEPLRAEAEPGASAEMAANVVVEAAVEARGVAADVVVEAAVEARGVRADVAGGVSCGVAESPNCEAARGKAACGKAARGEAARGEAARCEAARCELGAVAGGSGTSRASSGMGSARLLRWWRWWWRRCADDDVCDADGSAPQLERCCPAPGRRF